MASTGFGGVETLHTFHDDNGNEVFMSQREYDAYKRLYEKKASQSLSGHVDDMPRYWRTTVYELNDGSRGYVDPKNERELIKEWEEQGLAPKRLNFHRAKGVVNEQGEKMALPIDFTTGGYGDGTGERIQQWLHQNFEQKDETSDLSGYLTPRMFQALGYKTEEDVQKLIEANKSRIERYNDTVRRLGEMGIGDVYGQSLTLGSNETFEEGGWNPFDIFNTKFNPLGRGLGEIAKGVEEKYGGEDGLHRLNQDNGLTWYEKASIGLAGGDFDNRTLWNIIKERREKRLTLENEKAVRDTTWMADTTEMALDMLGYAGEMALLKGVPSIVLRGTGYTAQNQADQVHFNPTSGGLEVTRKGMDGLEAYIKGYGAAGLEWAIEKYAGQLLFKPAAKLTKGASKLAGAGFGAVSRKVLPSTLRKFSSEVAGKAGRGFAEVYDAVAANPFTDALRQVGRRTGVSANVFEEMGEEFVQAAVEGGFNLRNQSENEGGLTDAFSAVAEVAKQTPSMVPAILLYGAGTGLTVRGAQGLYNYHLSFSDAKKVLREMGVAESEIEGMSKDDANDRLFTEMKRRGGSYYNSDIVNSMSEEDVDDFLARHNTMGGSEGMTLEQKRRAVASYYDNMGANALTDNAIRAMNRVLMRQIGDGANHRDILERLDVDLFSKDPYAYDFDTREGIRRVMLFKSLASSNAFNNTIAGEMLHDMAAQEEAQLERNGKTRGLENYQNFLKRYRDTEAGESVALPTLDEASGRGGKYEATTFVPPRTQAEFNNGGKGIYSDRHTGIRIETVPVSKTVKPGVATEGVQYRVTTEGRKYVGAKDETPIDRELRILGIHNRVVELPLGVKTQFDTIGEAVEFANRLSSWQNTVKRNLLEKAQAARKIYEGVRGGDAIARGGVVTIPSLADAPMAVQEEVKAAYRRNHPEADEATVEREAARVHGLTSAVDGRAYIFLNNNGSPWQLLQTVQHEAFHQGVYDAFKGDKKLHREAMLKLAKNPNAPEWLRKVDVNNWVAVEEALAEMAETLAKHKGLWRAARDAFSSSAAQMNAFNIGLSDGDVAKILWGAYKTQRLGKKVQPGEFKGAIYDNLGRAKPQQAETEGTAQQTEEATTVETPQTETTAGQATQAQTRTETPASGKPQGVVKGNTELFEGEEEGQDESDVVKMMEAKDYPPVEETPIDDTLKVNDRIKQFKTGADPKTGVREPLDATTFSFTTAGPIRVMEFKDGTREVITGRHRLDLARRLGLKSIPARVYRESNGMTVEKAKAIDAIENIQQGKGRTRDFIFFFESTKLNKEDLRKLGARGARGSEVDDAYNIAMNAIPEVRSYALDEGGKVSLAVAGAIAEQDKRIQRALLDSVLKSGTKDASAVRFQGRALTSNIGNVETIGEQEDLFGGDDPMIEEARILGLGVAAYTKEIEQDRTTVMRGINLEKDFEMKPATQKRLGIKNVSDVAELRRIHERLTRDLAEWNSVTISGEKRKMAMERGQEIDAKRKKRGIQDDLSIQQSAPAKPATSTKPKRVGTSPEYVLSGDAIRATMPGYNPRNWKTHKDETNYVSARYEEAFSKLLNERKGKGIGDAKGMVLFLAGGNGAGKSTATKAIPDEYDFIIDSTLGSLDSAKKQIKRILENGQHPHIIFVYNTPERAIDNVNTRVAKGGHNVSPLSFANSHTKPLENLPLLVDAFGDKISVEIYDNSGGELKRITLDELVQKGIPNHEQIRQLANRRLTSPTLEVVGQDVRGVENRIPKGGSRKAADLRLGSLQARGGSVARKGDGPSVRGGGESLQRASGDSGSGSITASDAPKSSEPKAKQKLRPYFEKLSALQNELKDAVSALSLMGAFHNTEKMGAGQQRVFDAAKAIVRHFQGRGSIVDLLSLTEPGYTDEADRKRLYPIAEKAIRQAWKGDKNPSAIGETALKANSVISNERISRMTADEADTVSRIFDKRESNTGRVPAQTRVAENGAKDEGSVTEAAQSVTDEFDRAMNDVADLFANAGMLRENKELSEEAHTAIEIGLRKLVNVAIQKRGITNFEDLAKAVHDHPVIAERGEKMWDAVKRFLRHAWNYICDNSNPDGKLEEVSGKEAKAIYDAIDRTPTQSVQANEVQPSATSVMATAENADPRSLAVAQEVADRLKGFAVSRDNLVAMVRKVFGEDAEGLDIKAISDIGELGTNLFFKNYGNLKANVSIGTTGGVLQGIKLVRDVLARVPSQSGRRTAEQNALQQFSTVPTEALAAVWAANIRKGETVLEPSAGVGGLAVFANMVSGAPVITNEYDPRRANLLAQLGVNDGVFMEDASHLSSIFEIKAQTGEVQRPSVVVMNPPFSSNVKSGEKSTAYGAKHLTEALEFLAPGGRLVAIVGSGMADGAPAFRQWWKNIKAQYRVRANVTLNGQEYAKYGTKFDNNVIIIDKVAPLAGETPVVGRAETVEDLVRKLKEVRNDRPNISNVQPTAVGGVRPATVNERLAQGSGGDLDAGTARAASARQGDDSGVGSAARAGVSTRSVYRTNQSTGNALGQQQGGIDGVDVVDGTGESSLGGRGGDVSGVVQPGKVVGAFDTHGLSGERESDGRGGIARIGENQESESRNSGSRGRGSFGRSDEGSGGDVSAGRVVGGGVSSVENDEYSDSTRGSRDAGLEVGELSPTDKRERGGGDSGHALVKPNYKDGSIFQDYTPAETPKEWNKPHIGVLVETTAMSLVQAPEITYTPDLPDDTPISDAQYEAVSRAGQAHQTIDDNGNRGGFLIGDGTGVGKGREIASIIFDNYRQGRKKAVWVSKDTKLEDAARRDVGDVGVPMEVHGLFYPSDTPNLLKQNEGIAFMAYSTVRTFNGIDSDGRFLAPAKRKYKKGEMSPLQALQLWLPKDFDGVIAFDESHKASNAVGKGMSATAKGVIGLQRAYPKARIVYITATAATEVSNLGYAERLGLWGSNDAPFSSVEEFIEAMESGGVASMEVASQSLKSRGRFVARSISYEGIGTRRLVHELSESDTKRWEEASSIWRLILKESQEALIKSNAINNKQVLASFNSNYYGKMLNFYNTFMTSLQMKSVITEARKDLEHGESVVFQITQTNEAQANHQAEKVKKGEIAEDEIDLSPRDILLNVVEIGFNTDLYENVKDEDGNVSSQPVMHTVRDPKTGELKREPVQNPELVRRKNELLDKIKSIYMPPAAMDFIIEAFGIENVAEITGRTIRFNPSTGKLEKRDSEAAKVSEADAFNNGKKRILIFSEAGGTGRSYHASNTFSNKTKRNHYVVQAGWRAQDAIQGLGRTHRTNEAKAPEYVLCMTNVPAHMRFISTIARRLGQMGALTGGDRSSAGGGGLLGEGDNLEGKYPEQALRGVMQEFVNSTQIKNIPSMELFRAMGFASPKVEKESGAVVWVNKLIDDNRKIKPEKWKQTQVLNRIMVLPFDWQVQIFDRMKTIQEALIEVDKANGTYSDEAISLKGEKIELISEEVVYQDPKQPTVQTLVNEVEVTRRLKKIDAGKAAKMAEMNKGEFYVRRESRLKDAKITAVEDIVIAWRAPDRVTSRGEIVSQMKKVYPDGRGGIVVSRNFAQEYMSLEELEGDIRRLGNELERLSENRKYYEHSPQMLKSFDDQLETQKRRVDSLKTLARGGNLLASWEEAKDLAPSTRKTTERFITGDILSVWSKVNLSSPQVYRVAIENGQRFLGVQVTEDLSEKLKDVLAAHQAMGGGDIKEYAEKVFNAVLNEGKAIELVNGWTLTRKRLNGVPRVVVSDVEQFQYAALSEMGANVEYEGARPIAYFPNNAEGRRGLESVVKKFPPAVAGMLRENMEAKNNAPGNNIQAQGSSNRELGGLSRSSNVASPVKQGTTRATQSEELPQIVSNRIENVKDKIEWLEEKIARPVTSAIDGHGNVTITGGNFIKTVAPHLDLKSVSPTKDSWYGTFVPLELDENRELRMSNHGLGIKNVERAGAENLVSIVIGGQNVMRKELGNSALVQPVEYRYNKQMFDGDRVKRLLYDLSQYLRTGEFPNTSRGNVFKVKQPGMLRENVEASDGEAQSPIDVLNEFGRMRRESMPKGKAKRFAEGVAEAFTPKDGESHREYAKRKAQVAADWMTETFIDARAPLIKAMKEITGGRKLNEDEDVAHAMQTSYGRVVAEHHAIEHDFVKPVIRGLLTSGVSIEDFDTYLYATFAPERNQMIRERADWKDAGAGITDERAKVLLEGIRQKYGDKKLAEIERLANKVYQMNRANLMRLANYGVLSQEQVAEWMKLSPHYVPLRDDLERIGGVQLGSLASKPFRNAVGRYSEAYDSHFTWSILQAKQGVIWAEQNYINNVALSFCRQNASAEDYRISVVPLKVEKLYREKKGFRPQDAEPLRTTDPAENEKLQLYRNAGYTVVQDPKDETVFWVDGEEMKKVLKVKKGVDSLRTQEPQNVPVRVNGRRVYIFFNSEKGSRGKKMGMAITKANMVHWDNPVWKGVERLTRLKAAMTTIFSPTFTLRNMISDVVQTTGIMLTEQRFKELGDVFKHYKSSLKEFTRWKRTGAYDTSTKMGRYLEEAITNGMLTGIYAKSTYDETALDVVMKQMREMDHEMNKGKDIFSVIAHRYDKVKNFLQAMAEVPEVGIRLAVYSAMRDNGMSIADATVYAREITVDFNKKGRLTPVTNVLYMFSNAGIQSLARWKRAAQYGGVKGTALGFFAFLSLGFFSQFYNSLIYNALFGDDEEDEEAWKNIPDYAKERSVPILVPGGKYVEVPTRGLHSAPIFLGSRLYDWMFNDEPASAMLDVVAGPIMENVNFVNGTGSFAQTLSPTVTDPLVQLLTNETWTGDPLHAHEYPNSTIPHSEMGRRSTSSIAKWFAKGLNYMSGGDEYRAGAIDLYPEQLTLVAQFFGSAVGTDVAGVANLLGDATSGEFSSRNVPVLRGVLRDLPDNSSRYYEARKELTDAMQWRNKYAMSSREKYNALIEEKPYLNFSASLDGMRKTIDKLTRIRNENAARGMDVSRLDEQIEDLRRQFLSLFDEGRKR